MTSRTFLAISCIPIKYQCYTNKILISDENGVRRIHIPDEEKVVSLAQKMERDENVLYESYEGSVKKVDMKQ